MQLVYKIDTYGFYIEDLLYKQEWSQPPQEREDSDFTPVLLNPINPSQGLVETQPVGFHKPKWDFDTKGWTEGDIDAVLKSAKQSKLGALKEAYTTANYYDIGYMNTQFQVDKRSQDTIVAVLSAGDVPTGFFWIDSADNVVPMTYVELQGLSGTILVRNQANFIKYKGLKTATRQAETLEAVSLVEW